MAQLEEEEEEEKAGCFQDQMAKKGAHMYHGYPFAI